MTKLLRMRNRTLPNSDDCEILSHTPLTQKHLEVFKSEFDNLILSIYSFIVLCWLRDIRGVSEIAHLSGKGTYHRGC